MINFFFLSRDLFFEKLKLSLNVSWPETDLDKTGPQAKQEREKNKTKKKPISLLSCVFVISTIRWLRFFWGGFSLDEALRLFEWFLSECTLSPFEQRESISKWDSAKIKKKKIKTHTTSMCCYVWLETDGRLQRVTQLIERVKRQSVGEDAVVSTSESIFLPCFLRIILEPSFLAIWWLE